MISLELLLRFAKLSCYAICRQIFHTTRNIFWMMNGTYWQSYHSWNRPELYHQSAHVQRIFGRFKFDELLGAATIRDFVLTHDHFTSPEYVLKDNVSLYQVTSTQAIFVEVPQDVDVWRCDNGSFLRQVQFNFGRRVITMPLASFNTLGEKLGDPKAKLIFVQNTARCGSTLLVRMFEDTGSCVAFSEPDALNAAASFANNKNWPKEKTRRVTQNAVRLLCKPTKSVDKVSAYLMKMTVMSIDGVPMLQEVFPEGFHLFMYRDCLKVCQSLIRIQLVLPMLRTIYEVTSLSPVATEFVVRMIGVASEDTKVSTKNKWHTGTTLWCIVMNKYMKLREQNVDIAGVAYEDFEEDPEYALKAILRYCGLPEEMANKGLDALQKDAQGNSALSSSNLNTLKVSTKLDEKGRKDMNETLQKNGYPPVGVKCIVPGTITHKRPIHWPPKQLEDHKYENGQKAK